MRNPNWLIQFRDLPIIPSFKRWVDGEKTTQEQVIALKLLASQSLENNEVQIFNEGYKFYNELDDKLKDLDYTSFTESDLETFKHYLFYAFNYFVVFQNKLTVSQTYRLVVNEDVLGQNKRIENFIFLTYPSLDIVKKCNKYNRVNTPNTNMFYSSENIDTTLKEIRPPLNKLVTVGRWKPKDGKPLISYPISHSENAFNVNEGVAKATKAFEKQGTDNPSSLMEYLRRYLNLQGREFTKNITHHYEYLSSALFAERIFEGKNLKDEIFSEYDCIIYPSVGNDFKTSNLAILPTVIDKDFYLDKVFEFEIEQPFYDKPYLTDHPEKITLAKIKNLFHTDKISQNGVIEW